MAFFSPFTHFSNTCPFLPKRICQFPPSAAKNQLPELLVGRGSTLPVGQSVLLMERIRKWEPKICAVIVCSGIHQEKLIFRNPPSASAILRGP